MSKTFFISDTHFWHSAIIKYENRPFTDVMHMTKEMRKNWNSVVKGDDIVYHLGDFAFRPDKQLIESLNGKKILIRGNHDCKSDTWYRENGFHKVYDHPIIIHQFYMLSHAPLYLNDNMPYANLHGHIHGKKIVGGGNYFNCSVENINYTPIDFEEIKKILGVQTGGFEYEIE